MEITENLTGEVNSVTPDIWFSTTVPTILSRYYLKDIWNGN